MAMTEGGLKRFGAVCTAAALLLGFGSALLADEGMWTYDHVPVKLLKERYGFAPTKEWLDHLRLSSVNMHASASFVSPDGLILTNHHVAVSSAQRLSTPEHNYVQEGFYAKSRADELPIPGLTVRVLQSLEDVTSKVEAAVPAGASAAQAADARQKAMTQIEAACLKETGLQGEVVTLFGGARYELHRYKRYSDVRLVFVPEIQAADFGGDSDNFCYPRYALDMAFLRAYEDGQPAKTPHCLQVNPRGTSDGDLVFASGHPGRTDRMLTLECLRYLRDVEFPDKLARLHHSIDLMDRYSARGPEQARRAKIVLYFLQNSRKSREGELRGLRDPELMAKKEAAEKSLLEALARDPELDRLYAGAWAEIEGAYDWARAHQPELKNKQEMPGGGWGRLASVALTLLRYAEEVKKPDPERLPGYHEAELSDTLQRIESRQPFFKDLEGLLLADALQTLVKDLGPEDPYVKALLAGLGPEQRADQVMAGTRLDDAEFRKALLKDRGKAVASSKDPLLLLARLANPTLRATEKARRDNLDAVEERALTRIAKARFAVYGEEAYPDATGSLRLAFGKVAGYPFATTRVPPFTTFYGLYDRAAGFGNAGEFRLASSEERSRDALDLSTPLNTVCTADITGGNSGSPLVDREGRLVGLVFDGNMQSHPNTFVYSEAEARCVSVDVRGILEALRKLYGAGALADEMLAAGRE